MPKASGTANQQRDAGTEHSADDGDGGAELSLTTSHSTVQRNFRPNFLKVGQALETATP
jgi:hypothetical protein